MSSLGQYTPMSAELMDALRNLTDWIELANAASGGTLLPVVAGVLILLLVAAISWAWRKLRHIPATPDRVERILLQHAAESQMTCEEARAFFARADLHDVFEDAGDE